MPASIEGDLRLAGIVKRYGAVTALAGVDLGVRKGELLTILGPSGSGKTTLLKVVAGFETPDEGEVLLGGGDITDAPPAKRDIGMVFQNYALFPHMTVARQHRLSARDAERAAGPRSSAPRRRGAEPCRPVRARRTAARGSCRADSSSAWRSPARSCSTRELLLLDEPFGALDRKLREQMQLEVRRLQRRLGVTALFVTHDQEEALILSDRIAVMEQGRIVQLGAPQEIYERPANALRRRLHRRIQPLSREGR